MSLEIKPLSSGDFEVQFSDEPYSELNQVLSKTLISFNTDYLEFEIANINNKLQPFDALSKLIKVKKINMYLNILSTEKDQIGQFKFEKCQFLRIEGFNKFLNSLSINAVSSTPKRVQVPIDYESISINDLTLYKRESKIGSEIGSLKSSNGLSKETSKLGTVQLGGMLVGEITLDAGDNGMRIREEQMPVHAHVYDPGHRAERGAERAAGIRYEEAGEFVINDRPKVSSRNIESMIGEL